MSVFKIYEEKTIEVGVYIDRHLYQHMERVLQLCFKELVKNCNITSRMIFLPDIGVPGVRSMGPGGMFLNSSLAHVINTRASTCSIRTC